MAAKTTVREVIMNLRIMEQRPTKKAMENLGDYKAEIKTCLIEAMQHWLLKYKPKSRKLNHHGGKSGKPGSRCLIPDWQMEWATYQLYWLMYAKELPVNERRAAELYHIAGFTYADIAVELQLKSREVAKTYRSNAIATVANFIYDHNIRSNQCPRCGGSLMNDAPITEIEVAYSEPDVKCIHCSRTLEQLETEILYNGRTAGE